MVPIKLLFSHAARVHPSRSAIGRGQAFSPPPCPSKGFANPVLCGTAFKLFNERTRKVYASGCLIEPHPEYRQQ